MVVGGILGAISFNPFVILQGFFLGAPLAPDPLPLLPLLAAVLALTDPGSASWWQRCSG